MGIYRTAVTLRDFLAIRLNKIVIEKISAGYRVFRCSLIRYSLILAYIVIKYNICFCQNMSPFSVFLCFALKFYAFFAYNYTNFMQIACINFMDKIGIYTTKKRRHAIKRDAHGELITT